VLAFALAAATPVAALAPPLPECGAGAMPAAERALFGLAADDWQGYDPSGPAPGFAYYHGFDSSAGIGAEVLVTVLENCATRDRLVARVPEAGLSTEVWYARFEAVLLGVFDRADRNTARAYTLEDIAGFVRDQGAEAEIGKSGYESCACATLTRRGWQ